jgi:hypothetical protein
VGERHRAQQFQREAALAVRGHAGDDHELAAPQAQEGIERDEPRLVGDRYADIWIIAEPV